jgi:hypothetical protein
MAKRKREILDRLAALEDLARRHQMEHGGRGGGDRHRDHRDGREGHRGHGGRDDEKRVIDTVVNLVAERVGEMFREHSRNEHQHGHRPPGDDRDERHVVELVVDLVSERVEEIVAAELDRRGVGVEGEQNRRARSSRSKAGSGSTESS